MEFIHETIDLGYDDLVADTQPSGRTYIDPDGTEYPSVTTVLKLLSEDSIRRWRYKGYGPEFYRLEGFAAIYGEPTIRYDLHKVLAWEEANGITPIEPF